MHFKNHGTKSKSSENARSRTNELEVKHNKSLFSDMIRLYQILREVFRSFFFLFFTRVRSFEKLFYSRKFTETTVKVSVVDPETHPETTLDRSMTKKLDRRTWKTTCIALSKILERTTSEFAAGCGVEMESEDSVDSINSSAKWSTATRHPPKAVQRTHIRYTERCNEEDCFASQRDEISLHLSETSRTQRFAYEPAP